ncbi:MAG TPA: hypothetical protein VFU93_10500 [Acidimicrobiales bacterium]|nr:hypothetical protein [Acidimicrobiales bacterium]
MSLSVTTCTRRAVVGVVISLAAGIGVLLSGAAQADETFAVSIVPLELEQGTTARVLDLAAETTFAQTQALLDELRDASAEGAILVPLGIPGLEPFDLPNTSASVVEDARALVLTSDVELNGATLEASIAITWDTDVSTDPHVAVVLHGANVSLSTLNAAWPPTSILPALQHGWVLLTPSAHTLPGTLLQTDALGQAFPDEDVPLAGGATFRAVVDAGDGPLGDVVRTAGLDPATIMLTGQIGVDGSVLSGTSPELRVGATLTTDPGAPAWLTSASAELAFELAEGNASLEIGGDYEIDLGDGPHAFTADLSVAAGVGSFDAALVLTHAGELQLPAPLDWITIEDQASLSLRTTGSDLTATVHGTVAAGSSRVTLDATVAVTATGISLDADIEGPVDVSEVARLLSEPLGGFDAATLDGLEGITVDSLSFTVSGDSATGIRVSAVGAAHLRDAQATILFSALKPPTGPARLLAGLHLTGPDDGTFMTLGDVLGPAIGEVAAAIELPTIDLVFLSGSATLHESDLNDDEQLFFRSAHGDDLSTLAVRPGLSLASKVPLSSLDPVVLDLLGLDAGDTVLMEGYVGSAVGAVAGNAASDLTGLELHLDLPGSEGSSLLPAWLDLESDWDLHLKAVGGAIALRASADIHATISTESWDATLLATFERDALGVRASLEATLGAWNDPFGLTWFDLTAVTVKGSVDRPTGGPTKAAVSAEAAFTITVPNVAPKRFTVSVAVEASATTRGTFTAKLLDPISLGDVLNAVGAPVGTSMPPQLSGTSVGPVSISARVGGGLPVSLSIAADGQVQLTDSMELGATMLATVSGTRFTLGIRPADGLSIGDLLPAEAKLPPELDIALPNFAVAVTNLSQPNIEDDALTAEEQTFWAPIYGCHGPSLATCEYIHRLEGGVSVIASVSMPADVQEAFEPLTLDFSQPAMMRGTVPLFGGTFNPNLSIKLPAPRIGAISEFFEGAALELKLTKDGVTFGGNLSVRMPRSFIDVLDPDLPRVGEGVNGVPCRATSSVVTVIKPDLSLADETRCYDVLKLEVSGSVAWRPTFAIQLNGAFTAVGDDGWMSPFGVGDWIGVKRLAAQFQFIPQSNTVAVGMAADFRVAGKDLSGSIALALNIVAPSPPFVIPELLGIRFSTAEGFELQDIVDIQNEVAKAGAAIIGVPAPPKLRLEDAGFPDNIALRNLDVMYARQSSETLCLEVGLVIAGDLYVNPTGDPKPDYGDDDACRTLPSKNPSPPMGGACVANKAEGCFASVLLSVTMDGLLANGSLAGFDIGPIHWRDSFVDLALTLTKQHLALKGGAKLDNVFEGNLDLSLGLQGYKLKGDVDLFNGAGGAYIEAEAPIDLSNPNPALRIHATMHADFEDKISAAIDTGVAPIRTTAVALDVLWDTLLDLSDPTKSSVDLLRQLPQKMRDAGLAVPTEVELIIKTISDVEAQLKIFGSGAVLVDTVLNGLQLPDYPGWDIGLIPSTPTCLGWTVVTDRGSCWLIPPIYYGSYRWWNIFCWCYVYVPARWDYSIAIPAIVAQPTCYGDWDGSRCWAFGLRPFSFPALPGVCDLVPGLREWEVPGGRCTLRQVMERVVGPAVGQAISAVTKQPPPANLSQFLDQIVGGLKAAGGLVKVECATFKLDVGGTFTAPTAKTELALAMNLFGKQLAFGAAWDFSNLGTSIGDLPFKVINQLINPTSVSCQKRVSTIPPSLELTGTDRVDEDGTQTVTGTFATAADRSVTLEWGDGATETLATSGTTFTASHRYVDDDPTGAPAEAYVIRASYVDGAATVAGSKLLAVRNVAPSNLGVSVSPTVEGGIATISGSFSDAGSNDTHEVVVTWGDGSQPVTLTLPLGARSFSASHPFPASGSYPLSVVVTDDDTGRVAQTSTIAVTNAPPSNLVLALDDDDVDEGSIATVLGTFDDPGADDTHTVSVDWGDGSAAETLSLPAGGRDFAIGHRFLDDNAGTIAVTVTDDEDASSRSVAPITVRNVAPSDAVIGTATQGAVGESTEVEFSGSFADPGTADTHTVVVDWGAGAEATTILLPAGASSFNASHLYADDDPTGTASDVYGITVTVTDDDGGTGGGTSEITIADSPPSDLTFAPDAARVDEAATVTYRGSFLDAGLLDDHVVTVDWGDGTPDSMLTVGTDALASTDAAGMRTFTVDHTYADDGASGDAVHDYPVTVTVVDDDTAVGAAGFLVPVHNVAPSALALDLAATTLDEHGVAELSGSFNDPGTPDTHTVVVDWGDGSALDTIELDGEHAFAATHRYLDDAPTGTPWDRYRITVDVTDDDTGATKAGVDVRIENVAPSAAALTVTPAVFDEDGTTRLDGTFTDPGTRDSFTVVVDWGEGTVDTLALPVGARSFSVEHQYGDDGTFPISMRVTDDDTEMATAATSVTVVNVAPTLVIDRTSAQWIAAAGGATVATRTGEARTLEARSTDPGSDDLTFTWTWGDGTTSVGRHRNGTGADPDPSPTVGPRDVTDVQAHAWTDACLYAVPVATGDDDGGTSPTDVAWVIVTGTSGTRHGTGWWHGRYDGKGGNDLPASVQSCYLRIASHASAVFGEVRPVTTNAQATLTLAGAGSDPRDQLDRTLLSLWLDYADGAFRWTDAVDTDGNGVADAVFADVMRSAERVRLAAGSTKDALHAQRQRLQRMVLPGQRPPAETA